MSNIEIDARLVDSSLLPIHSLGESGRKAVETLIGVDIGPPPRTLELTIHTQSGKTVKVIIAAADHGKASVSVDGQLI